VAFSRVHEAAQPLYSADKQYFVPGQRISIDIFEIEESEHLLHPHQYASVCVLLVFTLLCYCFTVVYAANVASV